MLNAFWGHLPAPSCFVGPCCFQHYCGCGSWTSRTSLPIPSRQWRRKETTKRPKNALETLSSCGMYPACRWGTTMGYLERSGDTDALLTHEEWMWWPPLLGWLRFGFVLQINIMEHNIMVERRNKNLFLSLLEFDTGSTCSIFFLILVATNHCWSRMPLWGRICSGFHR